MALKSFISSDMRSGFHSGGIWIGAGALLRFEEASHISVQKAEHALGRARGLSYRKAKKCNVWTWGGDPEHSCGDLRFMRVLCRWRTHLQEGVSVRSGLLRWVVTREYGHTTTTGEYLVALRVTGGTPSRAT